MLDKIESLRKQPKHIRNRYAFWIALCVTCLIAFVWAITLPTRFNPQLAIKQEHADESGVFKDTLGDIVSRFKSAFAEMHSNIEYVRQTGDEKKPDANTLDLDALAASSTASSAPQAQVPAEDMQAGTTTKSTASSSNSGE